MFVPQSLTNVVRVMQSIPWPGHRQTDGQAETDRHSHTPTHTHKLYEPAATKGNQNHKTEVNRGRTVHAYCTCIGFNGSSHSEPSFIAIRLDPVVISLTPTVATLEWDTVQVGGNGINLRSLRPGLVKGLELRGQRRGAER